MDNIEDKSSEVKSNEFKKILSSPEKISKENVKALRSWSDYTLLTNDKKFILYNEKLVPIFEQSLEIGSDWSEIIKKYNVSAAEFVYSDGDINIDVAKPKNNLIPNEFHRKSLGLIIEAWEKQHPDNLKWAKRESLKKQTTLGQTEKNIGFASNNRYIIFTSESSPNFKVFDTQDDRGITLSPSDWKKYDSSMEIGKVPKVIQNFLSEHITIGESITELNNKYSAIVTDLSISILLKEDVANSPKVFSEILAGIGNNLLVDPTNKNILYFCQEGAPNDIVRLDMSQDPSTWKTEYAPLPKKYKEIKNLQLDPNGTFFLFYSENNLVMIKKDTLEEVTFMEDVTQANFDSQGRIRAVDKEGYLVLFDVDYASINEAIAKRKAQNLAKNINVKDIFSEKKKNGEKTYDQATIENLQVQKTEWENQVLPTIAQAKDVSDVLNLRENLKKLKNQLRVENIDFEQIEFITEGIEKAINDKEKEYAGQEAENYILEIETKLANPISIHIINELRNALDKIKPIEGSLNISEREKIRKLAEEVNQRAIQLFSTEGSKALEDVTRLLKGTREELEKMDNKNQFDDWMEFRFPQFKESLGMFYRDCPTEAFEASASIAQARQELIDLSVSYGKKFEIEYAKIREKSVEKTDVLAQALNTDIHDIMARLKGKQFKTRDEAEQYLNNSESRRVLETEILELKKNNPDMGAEIERTLKVEVANTLGGIERGVGNVIAETGQQMVKFGDIQFPRFEGKVKELHKAEAMATFRLDERSKGPGVNSKQIYGDVEIIVTNSKGEKQIVRLYEGLGNEDEWRLGIVSYRGDEVPPSYMTAEAFKAFKKNFNEWENGKLKEEDEQKWNEIRKLFAEREKVKSSERDSTKDAEWKVKYTRMIQEYGKFCAEKQILLLKRIDTVREAGNIDGNGKGYVPKWQNHWVMDSTTEKYLEQMAEHFKMQGDLKEGVLNLYGHAGTGKDVLIKMFANKTNRPYFAVDCTKWTTEFELSEDVALEAKDGATQTIKVPSSVLNGIQTAGAIVYFNEINGMPEQAQIFLHALFDEKRAMTLKTSSGKVIAANPSVLMACSMNPNYPGTFDPQFATKSRMVSVEIDYPPLRRNVKDGEPSGRELPYNSAEALRVSREVKSLVDFTYELNMDKNEFIKIWDKHINGINNDAPGITKSQEFDINVVRALVQFADILRKDFKINFDKTAEKRNALPVMQPLTLREMRRCAYLLSKISDEDKLTKDSDDTARGLIKKIFLSNIFKTEDRTKIENALKVMNSKNRVL